MNYYAELSGADSPNLQNQLLFEWLCDDERRPALYADLRGNAPVFEFSSRARRAEDRSEEDFHQKAYMLTRRQDIERALSTFSNSPYKPIGSGTFVLALDNDGGHQCKREFLLRALPPTDKATAQSEIHHVAAIACHHALVSATKNEKFDLVTDVAEQAALRFVAAFFGIPDQHHLLLQETMRRTYTAMIFQMFARHFVTDSQVMNEGNLAMNALAKLIGALMRDIDSVPLAAKLTPLIAADPEGARALFDAIARAAAKVRSLQAHAEDYLSAIGEPGFATRTARLIERSLDYGIVREAIVALIRDGQNIDPSWRDALLPQILALNARKQLREEQLVPRIFEARKGQLVLPATGATAENIYCRESVLERMVRSSAARSGNEIAVAMVGSIAGLVGNVIAGTCIAIDRFFQLEPDQRPDIRSAAEGPATFDEAWMKQRIDGANDLIPFIEEALRLHPPAAFVPRMTTHGEVFKIHGRDIELPAGSEVIVPLGAATRDLAQEEQPDAFMTGRLAGATVDIFGHQDKGVRSHRCIGKFIALPLIAHVVRSVLSLPGLARQVSDGRPLPLKKKWGYICESFPLEYGRTGARVQEPLNVVMRIRSPAAEHAAALKLILQSAAPAIEQMLAESKIVHFARFVFLNHDTELGLFTEYDGRFDHYIEFFAKVAGPLFDKIFEHLEQQPLMPVRNHPKQFVEHIRRFNLPCAGGYFFSAYPRRKVKNGCVDER